MRVNVQKPFMWEIDTMALIMDLRRAFEPDIGRAVSIMLDASLRQRAALSWDGRHDAVRGRAIDARQAKADAVKEAHAAKGQEGAHKAKGQEGAPVAPLPDPHHKHWHQRRPR